MRRSKKINMDQWIVGLLVALVIVQGATLYFTVFPKDTPVVKGYTQEEREQLKENKALLEKVGKHSVIEPTEQAVIATVKDVERLKAANPMNAEVYKDARDGDRVVGLSNRMIIYREGDDSIVYEGKSPAQLQQEQYAAELKRILGNVSQLTNIDPTVQPQLATVVDPDVLQESQPEIYKDALKGDKVLAYPDKVIIYRPTTNTIIYEGPLPTASASTQSSN